MPEPVGSDWLVELTGSGNGGVLVVGRGLEVVEFNVVGLGTEFTAVPVSVKDEVIVKFILDVGSDILPTPVPEEGTLVELDGIGKGGPCVLD